MWTVFLILLSLEQCLRDALFICVLCEFPQSSSSFVDWPCRKEHNWVLHFCPQPLRILLQSGYWGAFLFERFSRKASFIKHSLSCWYAFIEHFISWNVCLAAQAPTVNGFGCCSKVVMWPSCLGGVWGGGGAEAAARRCVCCRCRISPHYPTAICTWWKTHFSLNNTSIDIISIVCPEHTLALKLLYALTFSV